MTYSLKHVQELIERAIKENGADTKAECRYFAEDTGKPVCIVGHVFAYDGFGPNDVEEMAIISGQDWINVLSKYDSNARNLLASVQDEQDAGNSWGEAYESVKERLDI